MGRHGCNWQGEGEGAGMNGAASGGDRGGAGRRSSILDGSASARSRPLLTPLYNAIKPTDVPAVAHQGWGFAGEASTVASLLSLQPPHAVVTHVGRQTRSPKGCRPLTAAATPSQRASRRGKAPILRQAPWGSRATASS